MLTRNNLTAGRPGVTTVINRTSSTISLQLFPGPTSPWMDYGGYFVFSIIGGDPANIATIEGSVSGVGSRIAGQASRNDGVSVIASYFQAQSSFTGLIIDLSYPTSSGLTHVGQIFAGKAVRVRCIADEYEESRSQRSSIIRSVGGQPYIGRRGVTEHRRVTLAGNSYSDVWGGTGLEYMLSCMDKYRPLLFCPMVDKAFTGSGSVGDYYLANHSRIAYNVGDTQLSVTPPYFRINLDLEIPPEHGRR